MNELIKIEQRDGKSTVNARDLHTFLESKRQFSDWIKQRIDSFDFIAGFDYTTVSQICENGGKRIEYFISVDMAKELSMVENNEKGKQARKYFIECEKKLVSTIKIPQTLAEALRLAADLSEENEIMKPKALEYDKFMSADTLMDVGTVAKLFGIGRNTFFKMLRDHKILMDDNEPYQDFKKYFEIKVKPVLMGNIIENKAVTFFKPSGISYIAKRFKLNERK